MSYSSGKRLEFERELFESHSPIRIRYGQPRRGARILAISLVVVLFATGGGAGAAYLAASGFFSGEKRSIERMTKTFVSGLAVDDGAGALEACAESDRGAGLIQAEERAVFGESTTRTTTDVEHQLVVLRALRSELERAGVNWNDVRPISFAGVRARVESDGMKRPLTVLAGNMYFTSVQRNFCIEVSAWRCDGAYVIVDVWKGGPVDGNEASMSSYGSQLTGSIPDDSASNDIAYTKQLYVKF